MNAKQINKIIKDYNKLYALANAKIKVLEALDSELYSTYPRINYIFIEADYVYVNCDYDSCGSKEYSSFDFPTSWLSKTDAELEELMVAEKKKREEDALKEKEEYELWEKMVKEKLEFEEYQKLKAKFEK